MNDSTNLHDGKLAEVSAFGTGFIEDFSGDTCYGFHISMLFENNWPVDPTKLEGMQVRFSLSDSRTVDNVCLVHHPASKKWINTREGSLKSVLGERDLSKTRAVVYSDFIGQ